MVEFDTLTAARSAAAENLAPGEALSHSAHLCIVFTISTRYIFIFLSAFGIMFLLGVLFIQDVYELNSIWLAFRYLLASVFSIGYPHLVIREGRMQIEPGEENLLNLIGGPGHLTVHPGNAVLIEQLRRPASVRSQGEHFIPRFETILQEIISLEEQEAQRQDWATTKDGIQLNLNDVRFRYCLTRADDQNTPPVRTPQNPYPFSERAVHNMAYNRRVLADGSFNPWAYSLGFAVGGAITRYMNVHTLDDLMTPRNHEDEPRARINEELNTPGLRGRLQNLGAELIWVDIGRFTPEREDVDEQRLNTWGERWVGNANARRAFGQAQRLRLIELSRARAQAEILMSIVHAFEDQNLAAQGPNRIHEIILLRTSQILDAMSEQEITASWRPEE